MWDPYIIISIAILIVILRYVTHRALEKARERKKSERDVVFHLLLRQHRISEHDLIVFSKGRFDDESAQRLLQDLEEEDLIEQAPDDSSMEDREDLPVPLYRLTDIGKRVAKLSTQEVIG
ncbi:MAG: hypothetical protein WC787_02330 [Patescibacteria group bacterium]|jgi:methyl coenzyme M reductase subunit C-like uncharacterized protein (methanogenesis marker protein 7)